MIRLIALDLDGTALNDQKQLSPRTAAALTEALRRGVVVLPATGRTISGVSPEFLALPGVRYALTSNGARVLDLHTGQAVVQRYIPTEQALQAYDLLRQFDCTIDAFCDGNAYATAHSLALYEELADPHLLPYLRARLLVPEMRAFIASQPHGVEKLTMFFRHEAQRQQAIEAMAALGLAAASSLPHNLEVNAPGVNKGDGLLALGQLLGIAPHQMMACGDGGNDTAMLTAAGLGVAMGNAMPEVKAAANHITADNNHDGVALAVERFVLDPPQPRLLALDLDGTLLQSDQTIGPRTEKLLRQAAAQGIAIVPATGRPISDLPKNLLTLPGVRYVISTNGALVADLGEDALAAARTRWNGGAEPFPAKILALHPLPDDRAQAVYACIRNFACETNCFVNGRNLVTRADLELEYERVGPQHRQWADTIHTVVPDIASYLAQHPGQTEKFCFFFTDMAELQRARAALSTIEGIEIVQGMPNDLEVNAPGVNKGTALRLLARQLGLQPEQTLAAGDSGNDLALLDAAGLAVAMRNSTADILRAADYITTAPCDADGLADTLAVFLPGE